MNVIVQRDQNHEIVGIFGPFENATQARKNAWTRLQEEVRSWKEQGYWSEDHEEEASDGFFAILRSGEVRCTWEVFELSGPDHRE